MATVNSTPLRLSADEHLVLEDVLAEARACDDGIPDERRVLYLCHKLQADGRKSEQLVAKIKQQSGPVFEDSNATKRELQALRIFTEQSLSCTPHLVSFSVRDASIGEGLDVCRQTVLLMTKMPGKNLLDSKYWSLGVQERLEIQDRFLEALKALWKVGIAPTDRALRNIMWHSESKHLSIVDFEMWEPPAAFAMDEKKELQLWGLASRPPPATWHDEWNLHH